MATNIVVTSYDKKVKTLLSMSITGIRVRESYNVVEAEKFFTYLDFNVLILDIDAGMGSTVFLKQLQAKYKLLVIMIGSDTVRAMKFVQEGFRDFILKPDDYGDRAYTKEFTESIVQHIKNKAQERMTNNQVSVNSVAWQQGSHSSHSTQPSGRFSASAINAYAEAGNKVIGIASSTGGTEALAEILKKLPENMPPIVIVQHFPPNFSHPYAKRLDMICSLKVKVAETPEILLGGTVYIADSGSHIVVEKEGGNLIVNSRMGKRINGVMPAADVLFDSIAASIRENAMGIILTGMGNDGAKGLLAMKNNGAKTVGQNKETCIVYGMPLAAKNIGAVDMEIPLDEIPGQIISFARN